MSNTDTLDHEPSPEEPRRVYPIMTTRGREAFDMGPRELPTPTNRGTAQGLIKDRICELDWLIDDDLENHSRLQRQTDDCQARLASFAGERSLLQQALRMLDDNEMKE